MNYQKEYAVLVARIDQALSILEQYAPAEYAVQSTRQLLTEALLEAEERFTDAQTGAG